MATYSSAQILAMVSDDKNELKELLAMFIELCPQMLDEMDNYIKTNQLQQAGSVAHKLKSSIKLWEIYDLVDDIVFVEINGKKEINLEEIKEKSVFIRSELEAICIAMKTEYDLLDL